MQKLVTSVAIAASMALVARADAADELLEWQADPECSDPRPVYAEVERILVDSIAPRHPVHAHADVRRNPAGKYRVTLRITRDGVASHRAFDVDACTEVVAATALILAIAIDPSVPLPGPLPAAPVDGNRAVESAAPTNGAPAAPTAVPADPAESERRERTSDTSATRPSSSRRLGRLAASASLSADSGTLASPRPGLEIALGWVPGAVRFEGIARAWLSSRKTSTGGAGADFMLWSVEGRAAYLLAPASTWNVGPTVGLAVDRFDVTGFGGQVAFEQHALVPSIAAGGLLTWSPFTSVPALAFRASGEGLLPLARPRFVIREPDPLPATSIHRPALLAGRASVGVQVRFW